MTSQKMSPKSPLKARAALVLCSAYETYRNGLFISGFAQGAGSGGDFPAARQSPAFPLPVFSELLVVLAAAHRCWCRRQGGCMVHAEAQVTPSSGCAKLPKGFVVWGAEPPLFNSLLKLRETTIYGLILISRMNPPPCSSPRHLHGLYFPSRVLSCPSGSIQGRDWCKGNL